MAGDDDDAVPFHEWTPCEVHGHAWEDGWCRNCGEYQDDEERGGHTN